VTKGDCDAQEDARRGIAEMARRFHEVLDLPRLLKAIKQGTCEALEVHNTIGMSRSTLNATFHPPFLSNPR
jgi:hypothetical protein